jgi:hypothetical protein
MTNPQQLIVLGLLAVIAVVVLLRTLRNRRDTPESGGRSSHSFLRPERQQEPRYDQPADLVRWEVEMHDTARELKAELDTKMAALQVLIRQANEACERLERATAEAERNTPH